MAHITKVRDHLQFVLDHYYMDPVSDSDKLSMRYLIAVKVCMEDQEEVNILKDLKKRIHRIE